MLVKNISAWAAESSQWETNRRGFICTRGYIEVMISDCSYFVWLQVDQLLIKLKRRQTPSKDLAILTAEALRKVHNCLALRFGTCLDTLSFS